MTHRTTSQETTVTRAPPRSFVCVNIAHERVSVRLLLARGSAVIAPASSGVLRLSLFHTSNCSPAAPHPINPSFVSGLISGPARALIRWEKGHSEAVKSRRRPAETRPPPPELLCGDEPAAGTFSLMARLAPQVLTRVVLHLNNTTGPTSCRLGMQEGQRGIEAESHLGVIYFRELNVSQITKQVHL